MKTTIPPALFKSNYSTPKKQVTGLIPKKHYKINSTFAVDKNGKKLNKSAE
jgi:hypothetical protein